MAEFLRKNRICLVIGLLTDLGIGLSSAWKTGSIFWWFAPLPVSLLLGFVVQQYVAAIRARPKIAKEDIVYQERSASGASQKNILTRLGGGRNCVRLVVTDDLLWITALFPFSILAATYDMVHVIPLHNISSIERKRVFGFESILLSYTDDSGGHHVLRLYPKDREQFIDAIKHGNNFLQYNEHG